MSIKTAGKWIFADEGIWRFFNHFDLCYNIKTYEGGTWLIIIST